jgi:hypothetical protein
MRKNPEGPKTYVSGTLVACLVIAKTGIPLFDDPFLGFVSKQFLSQV